MLIKFLDGTERGVEIKPGAYLRGVDLRGVDLSGANLRHADLCGAYLSGADLSNADLRRANLRSADLSGANLSGADLYGADLRGANLRDADLRDANLRRADLRRADPRGAKGLAAFKVCPEVGQFVGFKKVYGGSIITLLIPADAKRVNAYGSRKCRAEFAYVLRVDDPTHDAPTAYNGFVYPTSGLVTPDSFDPDPRVECSQGIHFFMTRDEAVEY
jgi:hypothetical protein